MNASRRTFVIACLGAASFAMQRGARAAAEPSKLEESDAQAKQYGYRLDASKVDASRYPTYKFGQRCANCSLFDGKSGDAWGGCILFGQKEVAAKGWCSQYTNV
ncbi:high-potential iron-sulfur protein [Trinickia caryophylli]|uniref:High-potential iron-sulfur protein n=1 Tax=Trinickia caryophylli TaxID=28094 RepID=A0A1X7E949_TRICW|nr:high-potential iron-sulfur protein [Trinickia caryophylli]PMS13009.1 High potential iron-sulfur protein [Trinickia caryophylli]TRX14770.1 High potential iron-sulfur protein [Trinickia caryophylli]WQE14616.1 high-potential iron-sulfur protein [Trinickia caryophylli]SMF29789.1 High potential iron-sulfur protein [Trinickia caryophylli]GLU31967.1 high-potential iron-sulfur protein [Trinickia caryophylli]